GQAHIPDAHRTVLGTGYQAGAVGREDRRTLLPEAIAVPAEHADQLALPGVPEAEGRIFRGGDDARAVRAGEAMLQPARMPAQDGQESPRPPVPEPRRLVRRGGDRAPAVRAEGDPPDPILVSLESRHQPPRGCVPEARRVVGVIAPGDQPRP